MHDQKQIPIECKDDSLADRWMSRTLSPWMSSIGGSTDRRTNGLISIRRSSVLPKHTRPQRFDIDDDVRELGHGRILAVALPALAREMLLMR